jgi:hypothetical protein
MLRVVARNGFLAPAEPRTDASAHRGPANWSAPAKVEPRPLL